MIFLISLQLLALKMTAFRPHLLALSKTRVGSKPYVTTVRLPHEMLHFCLNRAALDL
jgi:hypothetical protein